jgi:hypothetical protein
MGRLCRPTYLAGGLKKDSTTPVDFLSRTWSQATSFRQDIIRYMEFRPVREATEPDEIHWLDEKHLLNRRRADQS